MSSDIHKYHKQERQVDCAGFHVIFSRLLCGLFHQSLAVTGVGGDAGKAEH